MSLVAKWSEWLLKKLMNSQLLGLRILAAWLRNMGSWISYICTSVHIYIYLPNHQSKIEKRCVAKVISSIYSLYKIFLVKSLLSLKFQIKLIFCQFFGWNYCYQNIYLYILSAKFCITDQQQKIHFTLYFDVVLLSLFLSKKYRQQIIKH